MQATPSFLFRAMPNNQFLFLRRRANVQVGDDLLFWQGSSNFDEARARECLARVWKYSDQDIDRTVDAARSQFNAKLGDAGLA